MKVSEHLKFSVSGFSPKRVADVVAVLGFVGIPLQFAHDWRVGVLAGWFGVFVLFATAILCFMQPGGTSKKFHPFALSLIAFIGQLFFVHL